MVSLLRVVWLTAVVLYCLPVQAQVVLRYRFEKDKPLYYEIKLQVEQKMGLPGQQDITVKIESRDVSRWSVKEITPEGEFVLEKKSLLLQFSQTVEGPFGKQAFRFDSTQPAPPARDASQKLLIQMLQNQARVPLVLRVDSRGRISQVQGIEEWHKGIQAPAAMKKFLEDTLAQTRKQMKSLFVPLPEKAPKVGDQWETPFEYKLGSLGELKGKVVHRYEGTRENIARFARQTFLQGKLDIKPAPGIQIKGTTQTKRTQGHVLLDVVRGHIRASEEEFQLEVEADILAPNQNQKLKQTATTKQSMRLLDSPPKLPQNSQEQTEK